MIIGLGVGTDDSFQQFERVLPRIAQYRQLGLFSPSTMGLITPRQTISSDKFSQPQPRLNFGLQ